MGVGLVGDCEKQTAPLSEPNVQVQMVEGRRSMTKRHGLFGQQSKGSSCCNEDKFARLGHCKYVRIYLESYNATK